MRPAEVDQLIGDPAKADASSAGSRRPRSRSWSELMVDADLELLGEAEPCRTPASGGGRRVLLTGAHPGGFRDGWLAPCGREPELGDGVVSRPERPRRRPHAGPSLVRGRRKSARDPARRKTMSDEVSGTHRTPLSGRAAGGRLTRSSYLHLAAQAIVRRSGSIPTHAEEDLGRNNVIGTANLLERAAETASAAKSSIVTEQGQECYRDVASGRPMRRGRAAEAATTPTGALGSPRSSSPPGSRSARRSWPSSGVPRVARERRGPVNAFGGGDWAAEPAWYRTS